MKKLEVKNISKSFGGKPVLRDVSIELNEGELVCLLGVSGGGKTTLFHVISGLLKPEEGTVLLDGQDITNQPGHISYMLQKDLLLPDRTIEDNVALPLLLKGMRRREARRQVAPMFAGFGLEGTQKKYPAQLSGGMRQRAALLRTYLFSHDVALLDEPLRAGNVITDEPGLYLEKEGIGVRIEDDIMITENGCINLSREIMKEVEDIEAFMAER